MSALIGALRATLGLDSAAFEKGASAIEKQSKKLERDITKFGKGMTDLGAKLSIAVTAPLVAFGVVAVKAAAESKDALGQVDAALKSMGDGAGRTREQLEGLATGLMRNSLFDDDEILRKVTANLLTFGNVAGDQFDRAQQAAVNLSARMKTDLQSSTIMIGKALNDPIKGLAALRRVGIQFTAQQKEQIEAMAEAGDMAGAQAVMLKELERQFGGAAKAARENDPMGALKQSWNEFQETVGAHLLKVLPNITRALERLLDAFSNLSPGMQQAVVIGAALAAALGPVLVPIAALAAAGYLIYQNWDKIAPVLQELCNTIKAELGPALSELGAALTELWQGPFGVYMRAAIGHLGELYVAFSKIAGPVIIVALKTLIAILGDAFGAIAKGASSVAKLLEGDFTGAFRDAFAAVNTLFGGLPAHFIALGGKIVGAIRDFLITRLNAVWDGVKERIEAVKGWFRGLYDAVVGNSYIPDMVDGIAAQMARLDAVMVTPVKQAAKNAAAIFKALAEEVAPLLDRLFPEAAALNRYRDELKLLAKAEKGGAITGDQAAEARRRLALGGHDSKVGDELRAEDNPLGLMDPEQLQIGLEKASGALVKWTEQAQAAKVIVVKSFKDMADETLAAVDRLASAIKGGGFLGILEAVIGLGLQLGSIGAFGKKIAGNINAPKVPGYAGGTSFHPGGLARVGERGPEVVGLPRGSQVWPNGSGPGSTVRILPSPYFEAVVDGRAARVAAPMAAASGHFARAAAQGDMRSRARRVIR